MACDFDSNRMMMSGLMTLNKYDAPTNRSGAIGSCRLTIIKRLQYYYCKSKWSDEDDDYDDDKRVTVFISTCCWILSSLRWMDRWISYLVVVGHGGIFNQFELLRWVYRQTSILIFVPIYEEKLVERVGWANGWLTGWSTWTGVMHRLGPTLLRIEW